MFYAAFTPVVPMKRDRNQQGCVTERLREGVGYAGDLPVNSTIMINEFTIAERMRAYHKAELFLEFAEASDNTYRAVIIPFIKGKVVLDVGCGSGKFWIEETPAARVLGFDVLSYTSWTENQFPKSVSFHRGEALRTTPILNIVKPTVMLLRNVVEFMTYAEIRRLFFNTAPFIDTLIISSMHSAFSSPITASPPRIPNFSESPFKLRFHSHTTWVTIEGRTQILSVCFDLKEWVKRQERTMEPCEVCSSQLIEFDFGPSTVDYCCVSCREFIQLPFVKTAESEALSVEGKKAFALKLWNNHRLLP